MSLRMIGALLAVSGMLGVCQAAPAASQARQEDSAKLLKDVRANAARVRTAAQDLEKLSRNNRAKWLDYDKRWNEIKPSAEELSMELVRLDSMRASLPASEQQTVDKLKPLVERIEGRTHELRMLLDRPGVNLKSPKFESYGQSLVRDARSLSKAAMPEGSGKKA
jgi:DNA repair exonuclease SbcCD ATPase subunit